MPNWRAGPISPLVDNQSLLIRQKGWVGNVPNGRRRKKYLIVWTSQRKSLISRTDIRDVIEYQLLHSHLNKRSEGRADHLYYLSCCHQDRRNQLVKKFELTKERCPRWNLDIMSELEILYKGRSSRKGLHGICLEDHISKGLSREKGARDDLC